MAFEYPLSWPAGFARTASNARKDDSFGKKNERGFMSDLTVHQAFARLMKQIDAFTRKGNKWRIHPDRVIVSTMLRVRRTDSMPDASQRRPDDPGVAVYFELDGVPYCLPCDKWTTIAGNLAAVAAHLEAIRGIERWGVGDLRAQFKGFQALPDPNRIIWRHVLGFADDERPTLADVSEVYRRLRSSRHPDKGGDAQEFDRLNKAWAAAEAELSP